MMTDPERDLPRIGAAQKCAYSARFWLREASGFARAIPVSIPGGFTR